MRVVRPLVITLAVTALAVSLSYALADLAATGVGLCFCAATLLLVLRKDSETILHHGLAFGGLFDPVPLDGARMLRSSLRAVGYAALAALVFFPPFVWVSVAAWGPAQGYAWSPPNALGATLSMAPAQILTVAIPEEMFYRGYAQTALDDAFAPRVRILGAQIGAGIVLSSVVFAVGHFATEPSPGRLAVFFPSLAFGWLRARSGGIGAPVAFHAACNLLSYYVGQGFTAAS